MPAIVTPDVGEREALDILLKSEDYTIHLYVNDYIPVAGTVLASFTEMSTLGYASKSLVKTSWTISTVSGKAVGQHALQTWTLTPGTGLYVYGYYVTRTSNGNLLYAQRFGDPTWVTGTSPYDTIKILPKYSGSSEN